ncbi:MAG: 3-dehydroquinate synthase [Deltaproteobacteria bacterium]|nr:3-dehydroquinate synthase [Deltaproteobacteria bacterium]
MDTLEIIGASSKSTLFVGEKLENMGAHLPSSQVVIITDATVRNLYQDRFPKGKIIEIGMGEGIKTLETVQHIYRKLVSMEADRSVVVLGIGGGIVCDVAGFVASTYLRGVRFAFAATTLLAQVDASVGGKNGVNFAGYKNMVGVFNQPAFVICDPDVLGTLSDQNRGCGLGEVVKHAAIADDSLFGYLEENVAKILALKPQSVHKMVYDSVVIKSGIVNRDEKEGGERRKLNFGHTFGHAVEKVHRLPHGEAVSIGMMVAANLSVKKGYLKNAEIARLENLLTALKLPTRMAIDKSRVMDALRHDKKRENDTVHFVLLRRLGEAVVVPIPLSNLESVISNMMG